MSIYATIIEKIIAQQEIIIGPVALDQACIVEGLTLDWEHHAVALEGNEKEVVDDLISQYQGLFGQIAVEVSKDAVANLVIGMDPEQVPDSLK